MQIRYQGYNRPDANDLCVGMCYFNPVQYVKPLRNINLVRKQLDIHHISNFVVELVYPGQQQALSGSIVVRSDSVLFSKENLWNIVEKHIPDRYSKIVFMDSDILCSDPDWFIKIDKSLNEYDMVHAMDYLYADINHIEEQAIIEKDKARYSIIKAAKEGINIDLAIHHTGYVIALNRSYYHQLGGIFEYGITGYGDTLFWASFMKDFEPYCDNFLKMPRFKDIRNKWYTYKTNALSVSSLERINYLPGANILHLRHGCHANRRYPNRNCYVPGIFDLYHNEDGVLEINIISDKVNDLKQYWIDRQEDE